MRLLAVIPEYPPFYGGGIATYYGALLPALVEKGVDVTILMPASSKSAYFNSSITKKGIDVRIINNERVAELLCSFTGLSISPGITRYLANAWAAYEQADGGEDFDLVECTDWGLYFVPWLLATSSPPVVVRLHGSAGQIAYYDSGESSPIFGSLCQLIETSLLPRAEKLSTYSTANQMAWASQLGCEVECIPPPLNLTPAISSIQKKNNFGLVVGRVQPWKGTATLCAALRLMAAKAPQIDWIGRSVYSQITNTFYDKEIFSRFPDVWGPIIRHLPPQQPQLVRARQAQAKFVVIPSDWDVYNLTVVEAMSQHAVVICSTGAGASDLIENGRNGFLFDAGDPRMLANVIEHVQNLSEYDRQIIGAAARASVEKNLLPEKIAQLVLDQYKSALDKHLNRPAPPDILARSLTPSRAYSQKDDLNRCLQDLDLKLLTIHVASRMAKKLARGLHK